MEELADASSGFDADDGGALHRDRRQDEAFAGRADIRAMADRSFQEALVHPPPPLAAIAAARSR